MKVFERTFWTDESFDCKERKPKTVNPLRKYAFTISLNWYTGEYIMDVDWDGLKIENIASGNDKMELGEAILEYKHNECLWENLWKHAYRAYEWWLKETEEI